MPSTARQLRQPPTIEAIERVLYFADAILLLIILLIDSLRLIALIAISIVIKPPNLTIY